MLHDHADTEHFVQIYECVNGHIIEEQDIISIRVHDTYKLLCPICNTEQIKCLGDVRG